MLMGNESNGMEITAGNRSALKLKHLSFELAARMVADDGIERGNVSCRPSADGDQPPAVSWLKRTKPDKAA
jgi:hypothetical protein